MRVYTSIFLLCVYVPIKQFAYGVMMIKIMVD